MTTRPGLDVELVHRVIAATRAVRSCVITPPAPETASLRQLLGVDRREATR